MRHQNEISSSFWNILFEAPDKPYKFGKSSRVNKFQIYCTELVLVSQVVYKDE